MDRSHKIAILDRALELLGPKGEHWVQGKYFAYAPEAALGVVGKAPPSEANAWCVAGACGQAAYELGVKFTRSPLVADEVVQDLSLREYTLERHAEEVQLFNDNATSFQAVKKLVQGYIETLKGEQA